MRRARSGIGNVRFADFFDRDRIMGPVDRAERRVLNHAGALTRKIARQSIRKRKRVSQPGQPPSSHAGWLRKFIYYHYDRAHASVIVGPALLRSRLGYVVPETLEFGGSVHVFRKNRRLLAKFRPRPYMRPALEKVAPKFPGLWQGAVTSSAL